jgi:hypothetical protein
MAQQAEHTLSPIPETEASFPYSQAVIAAQKAAAEFIKYVPSAWDLSTVSIG